ncbi:MAG: ABC transporter permease [Cyclobacteriaceae bacterium]
MIKNYITVAWRSLKKHKVFTFINIFGLSLGMSVCLVIISLVYDQYQYDDFHDKSERTFRILTYTKGETGFFGDAYATSAFPFGQALSSGHSAVETVATFNRLFNGEMTSPDKVLEINGLYADPQFFEVFGFSHLEGVKESSLKEPFSVVLSEKLAARLFPEGDAFGQVVSLEDHGSYKVTGILKTPPGKTHIQFDAIASFSSMPQLVEKELVSEEYDDWENRWMNYNYVVLSDASKQDELHAAVNQMGDDNIKLDEDHPGYQFELQGLRDIVPGILLSNELGFTIPKVVLLIFSLLGFIVILTATINYANLSISKSLSRAREIGIRKVTGAGTRQILLQFLVESVMIAMLSLIGGVFIYKSLIGMVNELWIFSLIDISIEDSNGVYIFFLAFTLFLGFFTGVIPAVFLSKIEVISSLKGKLFSGVKNRNGLSKYFSGKKLAMGLQFGLTFILLISIFQIRNQADHLTSVEYGFDQEQVYFVDYQGNDYQYVANEYSSLSQVQGLSFASHHPAVGRSYGEGMKTRDMEESIKISYFGVDENYIDVLGLKLITGENFPHSVGKNEKFTILNEKAVERLGFSDPSEAVGQVLILDKSDISLKVIGVVKDYNWEPAMKDIRPLALRIMPDEYNFIYMKTLEKNHAAADLIFREKWEELDDKREFIGGYLNEEMDVFYQFFYDMSGILTFVALVALTITCLGFLGMMSFDLQTRVKEIGIRKVLGAQFGQLAIALTKGFLIMLVITGLITIPVGVLANKLWIEMMASYAPVSFANVFPAVLIVFAISLSIIWIQVWKNTSNNPVDALRSE